MFRKMFFNRDVVVLTLNIDWSVDDISRMFENPYAISSI